MGRGRGLVLGLVLGRGGRTCRATLFTAYDSLDEES